MWCHVSGEFSKQRLALGEGKSFLSPDKIPYIATTEEYVHNVIRLKATFTATHSLFDVKVSYRMRSVR